MNDTEKYAKLLTKAMSLKRGYVPPPGAAPPPADPGSMSTPGMPPPGVDSLPPGAPPLEAPAGPPGPSPQGGPPPQGAQGMGDLLGPPPGPQEPTPIAEEIGLPEEEEGEFIKLKPDTFLELVKSLRGDSPSDTEEDSDSLDDADKEREDLEKEKKRLENAKLKQELQEMEDSLGPEAEPEADPEDIPPPVQQQDVISPGPVMPGETERPTSFNIPKGFVPEEYSDTLSLIQDLSA